MTPNSRRTIRALGLVIGLSFCSACSDGSYKQSAEECIDELGGRVIVELRKFPDEELNAKQASIDHIIYGSEQDAQRLAASFASKGWKATAEPMDELNWGAILTEDASGFGRNPNRRIGQLCTMAQQRHMKYQTWRLSAPGIATHVTQGEPSDSGGMPSE